MKYCQEYFDFSLPSVLWAKRIASEMSFECFFYLCYNCLISFVLLFLSTMFAWWIKILISLGLHVIGLVAAKNSVIIFTVTTCYLVITFAITTCFTPTVTDVYLLPWLSHSGKRYWYFGQHVCVPTTGRKFSSLHVGLLAHCAVASSTVLGLRVVCSVMRWCNVIFLKVYSH